MTRLLEQTIARLRDLPDREQDAIAQIALDELERRSRSSVEHPSSLVQLASPDSSLDALGNFLIDGVRDIDLRCNKVIDDTECGLVYIREQFADAALADTGKKHTEELLISWLLAQRLRATGATVTVEECYPDSREHCDLMIDLPQGDSLALEVKIAWKKWVWTDRSVHTSSSYKGYLFGDASHRGTAHDFAKLERALWLRPTASAVLLVGFDTAAAPIDEELEELERRENLIARGWKLSAKQAWLDRRNPDFRIACWFWIRACQQRSQVQ